MPQAPSETSQSPGAAIFEGLGRSRAFMAGDVIIREGAPDDDIFFLMEGQVRIVSVSGNGREVVHNTLSPGTFFGEMAALSGTQRNASVLAETAARVRIVSRQDLLSQIRSDPAGALWMLAEISQRLQQANEMVRSLLTLSIAQRVRRELASRACRSGPEDADLVIEPFPNLSEMARKLNTDRENVSREVSSLTARGVLRREADRLVIVNPEFLMSTSGL